MPSSVSGNTRPVSERVSRLAGKLLKRPRLMLTILIVLGIAYWWYHVPRLDYLPITSSWRTEASRDWLGWAPCVYVRYRVPEAPADLVAKLRPILTLMGEVPLYERSSEELRADLLQVPLDKCQLSDIDTLDWRLRPQYRDLPLGSLPESELAKLRLARHPCAAWRKRAGDSDGQAVSHHDLRRADWKQHGSQDHCSCH